MDKLEVYIYHRRAGNLLQLDNGALRFEYQIDYTGVPLSLSMPIKNGQFGDKVVRPYLWGLLPEDIETRRSVARMHGVSAQNPFALLGIMGLDCPGAVQFVRNKNELERNEVFRKLNDTDIAVRIANGRSGLNGWLVEGEQWSLGGQQSKFALRQMEGQWYECGGSAATTHIFKGGIQGLHAQALNEYVCMSVARQCAVPAARVRFNQFESESAIIIERYDREINGSSVSRLHQEDLCQSLAVLPVSKYTQDGGPGPIDIVNLLMHTGRDSASNVAGFIQMLIFNYLMMATDAHAKNYSLLLSEDGNHVLAPLYDCASIAPYVLPRSHDVVRLAMPIGGENRCGHVNRYHFEKMVSQCHLEEVGISAESCIALAQSYCRMIPQALESVFNTLDQEVGLIESLELRKRMIEPIFSLCDKTANLLS